MVRFAVSVLLLCVIAAPVAAQEDNRAKAKAAFARAVAAEERKDWRTAVDEYLTAYEAAPHPDVLFNIAVVHEKLDDARQAATYYQRYLQDAPKAPDRAKVERTIEGLRKRPSQVTIDSAPAGAVIVIDGNRVGRSPVSTKLAGGSHLLVAEHGGAQARQEVNVEFGEPASFVLVVGGEGKLVVSSNEAGATVRIDGTPVGVTPWNGGLPPGRHVVIVEKPGFTTVERVVEVPPDGTASINAGLVRPLGYIPPSDNPRTLGVIIGGSGGLPLIDGADPVFQIDFGWRSGRNRADGVIGLAFGQGGVGYAFAGRFYILTGRMRPYLGVGTGLVTNATHARAVGGLLLADLGSGRTAWDVHVEAGAVTALTSDGDRVGGGFVAAGLIWHLRPAGPTGR